MSLVVPVPLLPGTAPILLFLLGVLAIMIIFWIWKFVASVVVGG